MNVQHFEKGFHYSDREMLQIAKKIGKLATYCKRMKDESSYIRIEAEHRSTEKKRDAMKVSIAVSLPGKTFFANSRKADVLEAVDRCTEKLEPQLKRYQDKHSGKNRIHAARRK